MQQYLLSRGVNVDHVRVIPNWADGKSIRPVAPEDNHLFKSWGLAEKFVVGYSGNMGRVHEFETILNAAARLRESKAVFLFIGNGAKRNWIESRARELGLSNVHFQPYQPRGTLSNSLSLPNVHLISLLPTAEAYVFPSKLYGILAAGRPVILVGDPHGEIAGILNKARCGDTVEVGDPSGLAAAIIRQMNDLALSKEYGGNARRIFEDRFDKRIALAAWKTVLDVQTAKTAMLEE